MPKRNKTSNDSSTKDKVQNSLIGTSKSLMSGKLKKQMLKDERRKKQEKKECKQISGKSINSDSTFLTPMTITRQPDRD